MILYPCLLFFVSELWLLKSNCPFLPELKIDIRGIGYNTYFLVFCAF